MATFKVKILEILMSKYAVVRIKGNQYKVKESQELLVDQIGQKALKLEVLLYCDAGKVKIGKPTLSGITVGLNVIDKEVKGGKVTVLTYKAKSRYRRKKGFRPRFSKIAIGKITP